MVDLLSSDEIARLSGAQAPVAPAPATKSAPPETPSGLDAPSPAVVARAQEILDLLKDKAQNALAPTIAQADVEVDENEKLAFVGHVLTGAPFRTRYVLFGGAMAVTFGTVSVDTNRLIIRLLDRDDRADPGQAPYRLQRFDIYAMLAAMVSVESSDPLVSTVWGDRVELTEPTYDRFSEWVAGLTRRVSPAAIRALLDIHGSFVQKVLRLTETATKPGFYSTPS